MFRIDQSVGRQIAFLWSSNGAATNTRSVQSTATFPNLTYSHIAVTYDGRTSGSDGQDRVKIYIDGVLSATTLTSSGTLGDVFSSSAPLTLATLKGSGGHTAGPYGGNIDQFRIFDKLLSASEVTALATEF